MEEIILAREIAIATNVNSSLFVISFIIIEASDNLRAIFILCQQCNTLCRLYDHSQINESQSQFCDNWIIL